MAGALPRVDVWFELHAPAQSETRPEDYMEFLRTLPIVYMRDADAGATMPGYRPYPEEEMKTAFGPFFWTSSIACLMAFAIAQKPEEIGLWGVHMASHEEYRDQRPGCQYFIQRAWDAGIRLDQVPPESMLLKPPVAVW